MYFIQSSGNMSNGTGSIDFLNIPQTFKNLQLRYIARDTGSFSTRALFMDINSTNTGYVEHYLKSNGSGWTFQGFTGLTRFDWGEIPAANLTANNFSAGIIDIIDYSNPNKNKVSKISHGYSVNGSTAEVNVWTGLWMNNPMFIQLVLVSMTRRHWTVMDLDYKFIKPRAVLLLVLR
jgi:hypothetical protein